MRQPSWAAFLLTLAVIAGGCGSSPEEQATPEATETPTAETPADGEDVPEAQPFESPVVEEDPPMRAAPSGLISSTNPQERTRQVQRNNNQDTEEDPFSILPLEPVDSPQLVESPAEETTNGGGGTTGGGTTGGGTAGGGATGGGTTGGGTAGGGATGGGTTGGGTAGGGATGGGTTVAEAEPEEAAGPPLPPLPPQAVDNLPEFDPTEFESINTPLPDIAQLPPGTEIGGETVPIPPAQPLAPPPPTADTARAIEITGVAQIGGDVVVIVSTPDTSFGRYVQVGETIANGRVRIVRVENLRAEPIVILEENGIEVARTVGEPAIPTVDGDEDATTALRRNPPQS